MFRCGFGDAVGLFVGTSGCLVVPLVDGRWCGVVKVVMFRVLGFETFEWDKV